MAGLLFIILAVSVTTTFTVALLPPSVSLQLAKYSNSVGKAPKAGCDATMLNQCTRAFFANFNVGQIPYIDYVSFEMAFDQYLQMQGVDGWRNIQTWLNTLKTCLGGQQGYDLCYDWNNLMVAWNITDDIAKAWSVQFLTLQYYCGPAFQILLRDYYCIQGVTDHDGPTVQQCEANFTEAQNNQPNNSCQNIATYLLCVEAPYVQYCGRAAGGLVCHAERIEFQVYRPDCNSQTLLHCRGAPGKKWFARKGNESN